MSAHVYRAPNPAERMQAVKSLIREPYAWPGGYPRYLVMNDGESLSAEAARENFALICRATLQRCDDGWRAFSVDINWEDDTLVCAHTGKPIPAAYVVDVEL